MSNYLNDPARRNEMRFSLLLCVIIAWSWRTVTAYNCQYFHNGELFEDIRWRSKEANCSGSSSLKCHQIDQGQYCVATNLVLTQQGLFLDCASTGTLNWQESAFGYGAQKWLYKNLHLQPIPYPTVDIDRTVYFVEDMYQCLQSWHGFEDVTHLVEVVEAYIIDPSDLQVVVITPTDRSVDKPKHIYQDVWKTFCPRHGIATLTDLLKDVQAIRIKRAVFNIHGGVSVLSREAGVISQCAPSPLINKAMDHILNGLKEVNIYAPTLRKHKLYLLRKTGTNDQSPSRRIGNEDELVAQLQSRGVLIVDMGAMTTQEQLQLAANSDTIIGLHGAALTWGLFMPSGSLIVEIMVTFRCTCFENVARWRGHRYTRINVGRPLAPVDIDHVIRAVGLA